MQIDVSGDSIVGETPTYDASKPNLGDNPTHIAISPNNSSAFRGECGKRDCGRSRRCFVLYSCIPIRRKRVDWEP